MKFRFVGWPTNPAKLSVKCRGVAKLVKAPDFDSGMRGFESFLPCQKFSRISRLSLKQVHDEQPQP